MNLKNKKNIIMELIILITIIASIFTIYYVYNELRNTVPTESESNIIKNYSKNRYIMIQKDLSELSKYEIPEPERIVNENSYYQYYITATDNYINTIDEVIEIAYDNNIEEVPLDKDILINYCNSFNDINSSYKLTCNYQNYTLKIKNTFYLNTIFTKEIKTKSFTLNKDVSNDDLLDKYLEELEKKEISYQEIEKIK